MARDVLADGDARIFGRRRATVTDGWLLVVAWRQLPYADPGLPLELLTPDWNAVAAEELSADLREMLAGPAGDHVRATPAPARRG